LLSQVTDQNTNTIKQYSRIAKHHTYTLCAFNNFNDLHRSYNITNTWRGFDSVDCTYINVSIKKSAILQWTQ